MWPLLADHFLRLTIKRNGMTPVKLSSEATEHLKCHKWPGNVRELENTIARACALTTNDVLLPDDIEFTRRITQAEDTTTERALAHLRKVAPNEQGFPEWLREQLGK